MRHNILRNLLEELLDPSDEILIPSESKRAALYHSTDGEAWLLGGDFSGSESEREAEVRRIMNGNSTTKV